MRIEIDRAIVAEPRDRSARRCIHSYQPVARREKQAPLPGSRPQSQPAVDEAGVVVGHEAERRGPGVKGP